MSYTRGPGKRDRKGAEEVCGRIFTSLHDYLDGEIDPELGAELEALREKCPYCVDTFLKTLGQTVDVYRHVPSRSLSSDDKKQLHELVRQGIDQINREEE